MSGNIFRVLSSKLYGKEYATVLYLALRLSSINYLFLRLKKAKLAINQLLLCVMNEKDERDIDERHETTAKRVFDSVLSTLGEKCLLSDIIF